MINQLWFFKSRWWWIAKSFSQTWCVHFDEYVSINESCYLYHYVRWFSLHENSFHSNIEFTYLLELGNNLAFLDVSITRINKNEIEPSVYRKATNINIYKTYFHSPWNWKTGAKLISSTKLLLRNWMYLKCC